MGIFDQIRQKMFNTGDVNADELQTANDQPQEDKELASFVKNRFEESRSQANRISHEGIWMTNIAYLLGFDSIYYDPTLRQFRPVGRSSSTLKRNRVHENLILPGVQNRLARMLKNPPKYDVRPKSMEEEDKDAARLSIEVINQIFDEQHINRKRIEHGMWLQECGHAYIGVSNDDTLGEPLVDPTTGELLGYTGGVRIDVVSAFEGFPDPLAKNFEDLGWFGRAKVRRLDYFREHYPERGDLVKEEGAWLLSAQYEMRINTLNSVGASSSGTSEQMKNSAIELSYYERKSRKYPMGRHIIVANGVLLKNDELAVGEIPYSKFDDIVVGGKYYSEAYITHARPLQDQYNRVYQKRADWTNKLLAGKYIAAKGHGIIQEAFNDQSGEIIEYNPIPNAAPPSAMSLPVIPSYAYQETDTIRKNIYENMGLSEFSRGNVPYAGIPAQGMQMLLDQDETRVGIEVEQHEHAWARVAQLVLKYVGKYALMPRKLKTKGKNQQYEVREYTGSDLRDNFDAIVIRGSTLPNNKILKRQEILNAFQMGLMGPMTDPATLEKVTGMLEYGEVGEIWKDFHLDMMQIQKTIEMLEQEQPAPINKYDNHPLHLVEKNRYRKSSRWDMLSPQAQEIFLQDMDAHAKVGAMLANPQLMHPPSAGTPPLPMPEGLANPPPQPQNMDQGPGGLNG